MFLRYYSDIVMYVFKLLVYTLQQLKLVYYYKVQSHNLLYICYIFSDIEVFNVELFYTYKDTGSPDTEF